MNATTIVAGEEISGTWFRGWGPWFAAVVAVAFSGIAIALGYSGQLNLLDAREGLAVVVRMSIGVGALLVVLSMADSISGMRDRSTLEPLLLTPITGRSLLGGKLLAAGSGWVVVFLISLPYLYVIGDGLGTIALAVGLSVVLGALLSITFGAGAAVLSIRSRTNLQTLGVGLLGLALLAIPLLLPASVLRNPIGELLVRADPMSAAQHLIGALIVDEATLASEVSWFLSPVLAALITSWLLWKSARFIELEPGI
ncbi:MAG: hypothetical protein KJO36_05805 [Acidimicrobiia bacterium]|nr:hypothetical protein [Acidimicrobiia bacterium]NNC43099.1 hypothetical protein [Acidimicrobiia bacterium]NNL48459.1 hypothetical protein [Acidimicrobiia bacterium]